MRRARLCLVVGSAEMFLCCSMTIGVLGFIGVVEHAVNHFRNLPEAAALAAANKRVANILAKEAAPTGEIVESKLVEDAEKALYAEIQKLLPVVQPLLAAKDYTEALSKLAALRAPIDAFFDNVMVMAEDAELKANRLRILAQLRGLFTAVADISVLQH